jgi:hypothetical protein
MTTSLDDMRLDPDTVELLRGSLTHLLTEHDDRPLADRLAEFGWADVVEQDPATALGLLFDVKGTTLSPADALGPVLADHLGAVAGDATLASATVGLPSPFGDSTVTGDTISVECTVASPPGELLAVFVGDGVALVTAAGLTSDGASGIDDTLPLLRVAGTAAAVRWFDAEVAAALVARAQWLLACELTAIARNVVGGAVAYTKERVQYGKPIGVFQALQHRLAGAHAMTVGAAHLAEQAGSDGDPWTATVAKCMAGQTAEHACTQAQQCYGAIGFTWEHEFHRSLRRTYALDRLFGDWRTLEHEIGTRLQAGGTVPRIGTL